ncbi:hypothetical protein [Streptomyces catenulae]|uniref:hypothetical protein n=1 Tax=Streptomyces catenulae TaxID=66875 RepID=UPI0004BE4DBB
MIWPVTQRAYVESRTGTLLSAHSATWAGGMPLLSQVGQAGVPEVVEALADRRAELVPGQDRLTGLGPGPPVDGAGEETALLAREEETAGLQLAAGDEGAEDRREGGVDRDDPCVARRAALQGAGLVGLAVVGPVAADLGLGGVDTQFAPAGRGEDGVLDPQGDRFLGAQTGVVEGGVERREPVAGSGAGRGPGEQRCDLVGVEQGALVDGA